MTLYETDDPFSLVHIRAEQLIGWFPDSRHLFVRTEGENYVDVLEIFDCKIGNLRRFSKPGIGDAALGPEGLLYYTYGESLYAIDKDGRFPIEKEYLRFRKRTITAAHKSIWVAPVDVPGEPADPRLYTFVNNDEWYSQPRFVDRRLRLSNPGFKGDPLHVRLCNHGHGAIVVSRQNISFYRVEQGYAKSPQTLVDFEHHDPIPRKRVSSEVNIQTAWSTQCDLMAMLVGRRIFFIWGGSESLCQADGLSKRSTIGYDPLPEDTHREDKVTSISLSPSGRNTALLTEKGVLKILSITSDQIVETFREDIGGEFEIFRAVAWSPDSRRLAIAFKENLSEDRIVFMNIETSMCESTKHGLEYDGLPTKRQRT